MLRVQRAVKSEWMTSLAWKLKGPPERMKFSMTAFLLLIFILILTTPALHGQSKIPESLNNSPTCCLRHHEKVLPKKLVAGYRKALNCYLPAIIFVTKKNRDICSNPQDKWVQEYIKDPKIPLLPPRNMARAKSIRS
ncbi:C-C motif chemokine 16 [Canis lupus familiaris]|uniref:C-C motif chemokine n=3 Tax=Canis lupus TaxID=9612 RepID=A0A8I3N166_CANLF|nr:C-C motif chemokine 16 [Canis lupus dingo]XP_038404013.1 C-C motif chemokine 16 [Canis lupus familiaris]XP_038533231.1 C-C motif chemokine 16 [Canis lupus familiaris]XP_537724.3 C-C motif chemokine 16 [Canis lupus familiaris]|eukprot:XP_537724.3 C-C motif chemokine 16 [Canis lupus familiaris]